MINSLSKSELQHYTNLWCREQGIRNSDLDNHPSIDDVILLIKVRDEFWQYMNAHEKGVWAAYWGKCYTLRFSLKATHLGKLETIVKSASFRQSQNQSKIDKIKSLRHITAKATNTETMGS